MGSSTRVLFFVALLLFVLPGSSAAAGAPQPDHLLVGFKPDASAASRATAIRALGARVDRDLAGAGVTRLVLGTEGDAAAAARQLARDGSVAFAEPDALARTGFVPNDPLWLSDPYTEQGQWGWRKASIDRAWDIARGSPNVVVAVIDTGVDRDHPDLAGVLVPGATFTSVLSSGCTGGDDDDNSHGTHIAGVIGALANNAVGISGVASGVRIMPIKALDCVGTGAISDIAEGIVWATDHGARIVNVSLGTTADSTTLRNAVRYALDRNVLVVAAVGNCGGGGGRCISPNVPEYPAALPGVLGVGATASDDTIASFSTRGPQVAITAPGLRMVSTTPRGNTFLSGRGVTSGYAPLSGTSQASAFVAGVAALVWSAEPALTAAQVYARLVSTADDLGDPGRDDVFGAGRVNAFRAVAHASVSQGFGATYDVRSVPHAVVAGSSFVTPITLTNDTGVVWKASGADAVRLGYHWIDQAGRARIWDGLRTTLGADVRPGESVTLAARVIAPTLAAGYALRFDLVRDGQAWYSQRGVVPADVGVSVGAGFGATYAAALETPVMTGGSVGAMTVTLTNTGLATWPAAGASPVRLAYHWARPDGSLVSWDGLRAQALDADVPPGASVTTRLLIAPPQLHGAFVLRLDLVQEGVSWFSAQGIATRDLGFVID